MLKTAAFCGSVTVVGSLVGFFSEKWRNQQLIRWPLRLVPLLYLVYAKSLERYLPFAVCFYAGRMLGGSFVAIGLTGGIASGKSSVSKCFMNAGAVIVDADKLARQVVEPGRGAYREIVQHFGIEVLQADQTIDRTKLGAAIFSDPAKRKILNGCTHKYIILEMFKQLLYYRLVQWKRLVVFDAPLLFESRFLEHFSFPIIVVACSEATQTKRLMQRDAIEESEARKRMSSQMSLQDKAQRAHIVIPNDGSLEELTQNAHQALIQAASMLDALSEIVRPSTASLAAVHSD